jgi:cobalamin 5'-phosphate synthase/cobalamin synthase
MKRLAAAIMFLTRLPVPGSWNIDSADVGRSTIFFPAIGALIGLIQYGVLTAVVHAGQFAGRHGAHPLSPPSFVLAVILIAVGVLATGALHLDGLADTADGFGGGRSREDVLRIMRDHAIGSYGAVALILILMLKAASIAALIEHHAAGRFLIVAPVLARASIVMLAFSLPYARASEGGLGDVARFIGIPEVGVSSLAAIALAVWIVGRSALAALAVTALVSWLNARLCRKKIQGMTGDTLGANVEICEALILALGAILTS